MRLSSDIVVVVVVQCSGADMDTNIINLRAQINVEIVPCRIELLIDVGYLNISSAELPYEGSRFK